MYGTRRHCPIAGIVGSLLVLAVAASVVAQDAKPGLIDQLDAIGGLKSPSADSAPSKVAVTATLQGSAESRRATLFVTAEIAEGFHIYSLTQKPGGPIATKIKLDTSADYKLAGEIVAQDKPKSHVDNEIWKGLTIEEHQRKVTWSAPIELTAGAKPENVKVTGKVTGQVCDAGSCRDFSAAFEANYAKPQNVGQYRAERSHVKLAGHLNVQSVAPGDKFKLHITAQPDADWHVYALAERSPEEIGPRPTLIVVTGAAAKQAGKPATESKVAQKGEERYYDGPVTWTVELTAPKDAKPGEAFLVSGIIGYQTCRTSGLCDTPTAVRFNAEVPLSEKSTAGELPLVFNPAKYPEAAEAAAAAAPAPFVWSDLLVKLAAAFAAGMILNIMPCVLPVIGLKIMAFVHQAGQSRLQIFLLNLWYVLGLMTVFMTLAVLAVFFGQGWGAQFQSPPFTVAMAAIVFVFALSFLGVWEVPIPGFVGSGRATELAAKEGAAGAFAKGVLTTILATPCTGPLLIPTLTWSLTQTPAVTFAVFGFIGLGMAFPYLLIGAFPGLVKTLPKPGEWMETFKHVMGFVMLGTMVFILSFLEQQPDYFLPTLAFLIGLWFACWWLGRTPWTAELPQKIKAWATAIAISVFAGFFAFGWWMSGDLLPWQPYTRTALDDFRANGTTVLVDFTADW
jgi:suppressor for copper-sensitivity B